MGSLLSVVTAVGGWDYLVSVLTRGLGMALPQVIDRLGEFVPVSTPLRSNPSLSAAIAHRVERASSLMVTRSGGSIGATMIPQ